MHLITSVPAAQIQEQSVEAMKVIPQEQMAERIVEQVVAVPRWNHHRDSPEARPTLTQEPRQRLNGTTTGFILATISADWCPALVPFSGHATLDLGTMIGAAGAACDWLCRPSGMPSEPLMLLRALPRSQQMGFTCLSRLSGRSMPSIWAP